MFEQLSVLVEPFERVALDTVGLWYVVTVAVMLGMAVILNRGLGIETDDPFPDSMGYWGKIGTACVMAPVLEETIFRIVPVELGFSLTTIVIISVVWALLHGSSALSVGVTIPVYLKLVLGGFYVEAILLHAFHNLWATTATHFLSDDDGDVSEDEGVELPPDDLDDSEQIEWIFDKIEDDGNDWDPSVRINEKTYDSLDEIPVSEWREYLDDGDDE